MERRVLGRLPSSLLPLVVESKLGAKVCYRSILDDVFCHNALIDSDCSQRNKTNSTAIRASPYLLLAPHLVRLLWTGLESTTLTSEDDLVLESENAIGIGQNLTVGVLVGLFSEISTGLTHRGHHPVKRGR